MKPKLTPKFSGIAFFGHKGSGKTTLASLVERKLREMESPSIARLSFAGPIKDLCRSLLTDDFWKTPDESLKKMKSIELRKDACKLLDQFLIQRSLPGLKQEEKRELSKRMQGNPPVTWRWLLQWIGSNVVRHRDPHFWVKSFVNQAVSAINDEHIVIVDDGRLHIELALVEQLDILSIGLACPTRFDGDTHETEREAISVAQKCRFFYSLPESIKVLEETANEVIDVFVKKGENWKTLDEK